MKNIDIAIIQKWLHENFPNLQGAYLFGSHATGNARADSDIDIAILIPELIQPYLLWDKAQELAILLHKDVDLVNLIAANTVFQFQIVSTGQRFITNDQSACESFESYVLRSYFDFMIKRSKIIDNYIDGKK